MKIRTKYQMRMRFSCDTNTHTLPQIGIFYSHICNSQMHKCTYYTAKMWKEGHRNSFSPLCEWKCNYTHACIGIILLRNQSIFSHWFTQQKNQQSRSKCIINIRLLLLLLDLRERIRSTSLAPIMFAIDFHSNLF